MREIFFRKRRLVSLLLALGCGVVARAATVEITIRAVADQMRFDVTSFNVFPGDRVRLTLKNDDSMLHNVVVCLPRDTTTPGGSEDNGMEVALAAWSLGEQATALQWVPKHPRVFAATKILQGQTLETIEFAVPDRPGLYPYVCTFPGHASSMFGAMHVQARVDGLKNLAYRVFRGPFTEFPNFDSIRNATAAEGFIPDGLIDAKVGGKQTNFAVEFTGLLPVPKDGEYTFTVAGDNGPVLLIDNREVLDHRKGNAWQNSAAKSVPLSRGEHRIVLRYWHARERRKPVPEVTLLWSAKEFKELPLSRVDLVARRWQEEAEGSIGMPLAPQNGEPAFYRNYIAGVMPSGFGVGYPGGANLTWDPVRMNIGSIWAGAFLDVKSHRSARGGAVKPIGFAVVELAPGNPLALLASNDAAWPDAAASGGPYRFRGYSFDSQRHPTFRYEFRDIAVSEFFAPRGTAAAGDLRLTRTLVLTTSKAAPSRLMFRVLRATQINALADGYRVGESIVVTTSSGTTLRDSGSNKEVLLPVVFQNGRAEINITYAWIGHQH